MIGKIQDGCGLLLAVPFLAFALFVVAVYDLAVLVVETGIRIHRFNGGVSVIVLAIVLTLLSAWCIGVDIGQTFF